LRFKDGTRRASEFPTMEKLDRPRERGILLHFFANHELLATELMALALLRFPSAPAAFRRGLLQTLKDEQEHTRLYLQRMQECGIHFGELPVSGYFWRSVSPMENPIDYVAGLCLTFEQANLDYAQHFARVFARAGDAPSAQLLERIYRDEIGHVAYGLKWFRRWKSPGESDWDAFCHALKFPLSPQRAKGFALNVEGRRAAGLDPEFIARLDVYSQSRGRTPAVYVFNPFAEGYLAQGRSFAPVRQQAELARDLEHLPQFLCRRDDIVLINRRPSVEFLRRIKTAGFPLPEFVELKNGRIDLSGSMKDRKLGRLRPWAWGPDSIELFRPILGNVSGENRLAEDRFNERIARLYSKAWSAELLGTVLASGVGGDETSGSWLCTRHEVGCAVHSMDEALDVIEAIRRRGHHKIVVKQALGLAGRNALRLWEPDLLKTQRRWMANALTREGQLVVEPWLERELDFSLQLEMAPGGLQVCGYTGLINDHRGQFEANWAAPNYLKRLPSAVAALFSAPTDISNRIHHLYTEIIAELEVVLRSIHFQGPIGIDALVYRAPDGRCRLKPIVEINPRYTMGRLTVELMKRVCPGSYGLFRLVKLGDLRAAGCEDFPAYARLLGERHPLRLVGEPVARIREGVLCLGDPPTARSCLPIFKVGAATGATVTPALE
jgi:uncharacterized ferritin-like protein (DUF455 family)